MEQSRGNQLMLKWNRKDKHKDSMDNWGLQEPKIMEIRELEENTRIRTNTVKMKESQGRRKESEMLGDQESKRNYIVESPTESPKKGRAEITMQSELSPLMQKVNLKRKYKMESESDIEEVGGRRMKKNINKGWKNDETEKLYGNH